MLQQTPDTPRYSATFLIRQILDQGESLSTEEIVGLVMARTSRQQRADWFPELLPAFVRETMSKHRRTPGALRQLHAVAPPPPVMPAPSTPQPQTMPPPTPSSRPSAAEARTPPPPATAQTPPMVDPPVVAGTTQDPQPLARNRSVPIPAPPGAAAKQPHVPSAKVAAIREAWWQRKLLGNYDLVGDGTGRKVIAEFTVDDALAAQAMLRRQAERDLTASHRFGQLAQEMRAAGAAKAADLPAEVGWRIWHDDDQAGARA